MEHMVGTLEYIPTTIQDGVIFNMEITPSSLELRLCAAANGYSKDATKT